jgi:penicillin-binding protein 2
MSVSVKDVNKQRQYIILGVIILAATILLFRAAQLQVIDSSYQSKAAAITIERNIQYPSRGVIYDRNNILMVYNNAQYDLMVTYKQVDKNMDIPRFCSLLNIDTATYRANLEKDWTNQEYSKNIPYPFLTMITPEVFARFQEVMNEFPGFFIQERNVRGYPQSNGGHVLGYLSEANPKFIKDSTGIYEAGDYIGTTGLERYYEAVLRGQKGVEFIMKDNLGRLVGPWKSGKLDTVAVQGKDLLSSIDIKLQGLGEYMMANKLGSIIAIEPKTGEILAMITSPTFDPQMLTMGKQRNAVLNALSTDTLRPMFNRAVTAKYAPGSVFKPMMALIAMQMGVWNKNNGMPCGGGYHYGNRVLRCHCNRYSGNMAVAIENSCNTYFCTIYRTMVDRFGFRTPKAGLDSLNSYIYRFGMGNKLGIDYPYENKGFIPTPTTYDKRYKKDGFWYSTYFVSNAIGQGENQLTTIQMANLAAIIANKGWYYPPHIIKGYKDSTNQKEFNVINRKFVTKNYTGVDAEHFDYVIEGMHRVIETGTGGNAKVPGIEVCGKTGTSENTHGEDSSVFLGFAPKNDPKIAIAVYVENGGWGNDFAAPMTGLMIEHFLNGKISEGRKPIVEKMHRAHYAQSSGKGFYVQKGY